MTAPNPPTTTTPTTSSPAALTGTQARALLHALLSTTPVTPSSTTKPTRNPIPIRRQSQPPPHSQTPPHPTITIDTSTRLIGHCNTIHLPSAPADQTLHIEQLVRGIFAEGTGGGQAINVTIQAGFSVVGSRNVVVFGGKEGGGEKGKGKGRKRGSEESTDDDDGDDGGAGEGRKRVKVEG